MTSKIARRAIRLVSRGTWILLNIHSDGTDVGPNRSPTANVISKATNVTALKIPPFSLASNFCKCLDMRLTMPISSATPARISAQFNSVVFTSLSEGLSKK